jgi:hypothetical protein
MGLIGQRSSYYGDTSACQIGIGNKKTGLLMEMPMECTDGGVMGIADQSIGIVFTKSVRLHMVTVLRAATFGVVELL